MPAISVGIFWPSNIVRLTAQGVFKLGAKLTLCGPKSATAPESSRRICWFCWLACRLAAFAAEIVAAVRALLAAKAGLFVCWKSVMAPAESGDWTVGGPGLPANPFVGAAWDVAAPV